MSKVRPRKPGASVAFLVGQRSPAASDDFLDQAAVWVKKIKSTVGAGVFVEPLGAARAAAANITRTSALAAKATLTASQLDANLGGLRGHTLVFTTHGLEVDTSLSTQQQADTQGLLFYNHTTGTRQGDVVMTKFHLDHMKIDAKGHVIYDGSLPAGNQTLVKEIGDFVPVVEALKQAVFDQIYLAACGGGSRLELFAKKLQDLTATTVFVNDVEITMPTKPTAPFAEVGHLDKVTKAFTPRKGFKFYDPHTGSADLDLKSKVDTFLAGSVDRLP